MSAWCLFAEKWKILKNNGDQMMQNGGELVRDIEMKKLMVRVNEDPFVHDDQESSGGDPHSFVKVVLDDLMRIRTRKSSCKCELRSQKMEISVQTWYWLCTILMPELVWWRNQWSREAIDDQGESDHAPLLDGKLMVCWWSLRAWWCCCSMNPCDALDAMVFWSCLKRRIWCDAYRNQKM